MSDEEAFLKRWSRRKVSEAEKPPRRMAWTFPAPPENEETSSLPLAPAEEDSTDHEKENAPPGEEQQAAEPAAPREAGKTEEAALAEADLPDVESLDYDSDYKGFMAEGVSEALRKRALQRLWRSNPILANVDGLNDYDDDFTDAALVKTGLKTAFDAVRGYASDADDDEADGGDPEILSAAQTTDPETGGDEGDGVSSAADDGTGDDEENAPQPAADKQEATTDDTTA